MTPSPPLTVIHQCPQCGGQIDLDEESRLAVCPFCRVRHVICWPDTPRYFIAPKNHDPARCTFIPYWRISGMEFAMRGSEMRSGIIDTTILALKPGIALPSLGIRTQFVRLQTLRADSPGAFLRPALAPSDLMRLLDKRRSGIEQISVPGSDDSAVLSRIQSLGTFLTSDPSKTSFFPDQKSQVDGPMTPVPKTENQTRTFSSMIGETTSFIYAPFYENDGRVVDALDETDHPGLSMRTIGESGPEDRTPLIPRFLAALCPQCGAEMNGAPASVALPCPQCRTLWQPGARGWQPINLAYIDTKEDDADLRLPFWLLEVESPLTPLATRGDLQSLGVQTHPLSLEQAGQPLRFWIPAFKMEAGKFLMFGRVATIASLSPAPSDRSTATGALYPVTLTLNEALQTIPVLLNVISHTRKIDLTRFFSTMPSCKNASLAYLPFKRRGMEYVQDSLNAALHVNVLKWAK